MSLRTILNIGKESLYNSKAGVEVTGHNIANAHTPGYSKQILDQTASLPAQRGSILYGTGAKIKDISRAHDRYLEGSILNSAQTSHRMGALHQGLSRLEDLFNPAVEGSLIDQIDKFSASINELSIYPTEITIRSNVIGYGQSLSNAFNQTYQTVDVLRHDYDFMIDDQMKEVNNILKEIADLNFRIKESSVGASSSSNDFQDKRDVKILELAQKMNISWYETDGGDFVIRGPGNVLLVEGAMHGSFKTIANSDNEGCKDIYFQSYGKQKLTNITPKIKNGSLLGFLEVRDFHTKNTMKKLDQMAFTFASRFNEIHKEGYGIDQFSEKKGQGFFVDLKEESGAARDIAVDSVVSYDVSAIATGISSDSSGDNIIANQLVRLFNESIFDGGTSDIHGYYANEVGKLGAASQNAKIVQENSKAILTQLEKRKDSISGVSLDEEAAKMLKYQHLFAASSKLITTTDEMFDSLLSLKR